MNFQDKFNRQIVELFDNLQEQVDTLAGEIAEINKQDTCIGVAPLKSMPQPKTLSNYNTQHSIGYSAGKAKGNLNVGYNPKLPKNWGKIKVNGKLVDFNTLNTFEDYDKKLDQILEERIDQTEKDTEIILNCLRYCRHRLQKHPESGIHKADVKLKEVKRLIKELE